MPAFAHRGVMLDLARLTERHEYYFALLPHLKAWGYNLLHLHFTDDQGCALRFPSHPELATRHAFSPCEMRDFVAEARRNGLEVVPEVECWGHTDCITRLPRYRRLREIDQGPGRFSGMCVFEPDARRLLKDLLRDTMDIFQPRLIHAGLDEVNFGYHPTTRRLLRTRSKSRLFADHVNWCHDTIAKLGARMAMWGDHVYKDETLLRRTPTDTLIFDWHYNRDFEPSSLDILIRHGFEVYGCPAIQHAGCRVITGPENFENVRRFSAYALERRRPRAPGRVTGMVVTVWCPYRYVPGTIEYPLAVCGRLFSSESLEPEDFALCFARDFWGLTGRSADTAARALERLHSLAPVHSEYDRLVFGVNCRRSAETFSRADRHLARARLRAVTEAERALRTAARTARRNADRLADLLVAADFLKTLYAFGAGGRARDPGWRRLLRSMQQAWARSRYCDTPAFSGRSLRLPRARADYDAIMRHLNRLAAR